MSYKNGKQKGELKPITRAIRDTVGTEIELILNILKGQVKLNTLFFIWNLFLTCLITMIILKLYGYV